MNSSKITKTSYTMIVVGLAIQIGTLVWLLFPRKK